MTTMRAIVLDAPGPPGALTIRQLPIPKPANGWVLIAVKAFSLNRSELHTRLGLAQGVTFPRVLGIEATGVVASCPGGEFAVGQQVMAMMGGMGRVFDGGYAEYTCVPGTVTFSSSRQLGESVSEHCYAVLQGPALPGRDHQPRRVVVLSVPAQLP
jgi:NADPH:quinone reductase